MASKTFISLSLFENQDPTEVVLDFAKFRSLQHVLISNSRVRLKNSELAELKVLEVPKQEFDASFFQASRIIILISVPFYILHVYFLV